jgi:hypothetical protein
MCVNGIVVMIQPGLGWTAGDIGILYPLFPNTCPIVVTSAQHLRISHDPSMFGGRR